MLQVAPEGDGTADIKIEADIADPTPDDEGGSDVLWKVTNDDGDIIQDGDFSTPPDAVHLDPTTSTSNNSNIYHVQSGVDLNLDGELSDD